MICCLQKNQTQENRTLSFLVRDSERWIFRPNNQLLLESQLYLLLRTLGSKYKKANLEEVVAYKYSLYAKIKLPLDLLK